ncbi:MAG: class I SAM-dependent methyltransferase [Stellaceae bacterium]
MAGWIDFYDARHSLIYVNARHRDVHYRVIANDIRSLVSSPAAAVLDYGCGEATSAEIVAAACGHLTLVEAAPTLRAALAARTAANSKISVRTPDEMAALPAASFDLIVIHSVAQYLSAAELERLLKTFRRLIKPDGLLVLGDVVPPHLAAPVAVWTLLRFGAANGFFWAAVGGLLRLFASDYRRLKKTVGLAHYDERAVLKKLQDAGFVARRSPRNIGHNRHRMSFLARPA